MTGLPRSFATMTAGNGARRNELSDAENAWTTSTLRSSRNRRGQYQSWVTIVRRYLIRRSRCNGAGGTGSIGTIRASTRGSPRQPSSILCACTDLPPRIRSEATTTAIRRGGGRESCIWPRYLGADWVQGTRRHHERRPEIGSRVSQRGVPASLYSTYSFEIRPP